MGFKPWRPQGFQSGAPNADTYLKPQDEDVIRTLAEIEKASRQTLSATNNPIGPQESRFFPTVPPVLFLAAAAAVGVAVFAMNFVGQHLSTSGKRSGGPSRVSRRPAFNSAMQAEAEALLQRVAAGDSAAADRVLANSASWTGKTQRTSNAVGWITASLNRPETNAREAALEAELALDGVAKDASSVKMLEQAAAIPSQRAWALWMLGALGNRGVDEVHTAKIIGAYLSDPAAEVRASAVNGLALVGTDETIPMMLDRFRNDPSPVVQERAACAIAEAGMYTHEQRMRAAATLVTWLDDSLITPQQRAWTLQALHDISGQSLGSDSAAWRTWYESAH
jgi:HEAT repeat protein